MKTKTNKKGENKNQVEGCNAPLITPALTAIQESTTNSGKDINETKPVINSVKSRNNGDDGTLRKLRVQ